MKYKFKALFLIFIFVFTQSTYAQTIPDLKQAIHQIIDRKEATVGVAVMGMEGEDMVSVNGKRHFPMQSVFKFPVALAVLHFVDQKKLKRSQEIVLTKKDLPPNTYSPIRDKFPNGVTLKLSELIKYSVVQSDNIATDILFQLIGGPQSVQHFMKKSGISDISIQHNEAEQHENWKNQYENWITPLAANALLKIFYENKGKLLTEPSHSFLWKAMKATKTGKNSIRGNLPEKTIVAHKTGHSGTNENGLTAAINDIGIIFLPNGKYFYLSMLVSDSKENETVNQRIISRIAKVAWHYFRVKYE